MLAGHSGSFRTAFKEIWSSRVWLLFLSRAILFAGICCLAPHLQTELTNYFLHKHTSEDIKCTGHHHHHHEHHGPPHGAHQAGFRASHPGEHHEHHGPPHECIQAHTDVLIWTTGKTIVSHFTVSLFLNAAVGTWSDMYGRKPFLILDSLLKCITFGIVLLYLKVGLPLYWYFLLYVVHSPFSSQSICLAFIADTISDGNRLLTFAMLSIVFSIGVMAGTGLTLSGLVPSLEIACYVGTGLCLLSTFLLTFFLPETLPEELQLKAREAVAEKRGKTSWAKSLAFCWVSFKEAMKILWRTSFFRRLTIIMFVVTMVSEEYIEFKIQYLQEVLGFGTSEQSLMMMIMGISGFVIMTLGVWIVRPVLKLTDKQILAIGTIMLALSFLLLAAAQAAWMAYLSTVFVSFWMLLSMAISSMKSANVQPEEQGAVQGALSAISGVGFGLGPVLFLAIYVAFRHGAVYIPGAPFYFAFFLMASMVVIVFTLKPPTSRNLRNDSEASLEKMEANEKEPLLPEAMAD